jgi:hypothetical protein
LLTKAARRRDHGKKLVDREPGSEESSHKPAKHIEETARLASSVDKDKDPAKVQGSKN